MLLKIIGADAIEIENVSGRKVLVTKILIENGSGSECAIQYHMRKEKWNNDQHEIHTISGAMRIEKGVDTFELASAADRLLVIPPGFKLSLNIECGWNKAFSGIAHINFEVIG